MATEIQRNFLLSFFTPPHDVYQETIVNGFKLVRAINGSTSLPYVQIYSEKSLEKMNSVKKTDKSTRDIPLFKNKRVLPTYEEYQELIKRNK